MKRILYFVLLIIQISNNLIGMDDALNIQKDIKIKKIKPPKATNRLALIDTAKKQFLDESEKYFCKGELKYLDPLVGECQCHIRALMIAEKYNNFIMQIREGQKVELTDEEKEFLAFCRLLTKSKDIDYVFNYIVEEKSNYKLLDLQMSRTAIENIILDCQRNIANQSVNYMKNIAINIQDSELIKAINYVLLDDSKRPHSACYPVTKLVLLQAYVSKIPIILKISRACKNCQTSHTKTIVYTPDENKFGQFTPITNTEELLNIDQEKAAMVISGYSEPDDYGLKDMIDLLIYQNDLDYCDNANEFFNNFLQCNIVDIILQNAALHGQYNIKENKDLDIPFDELDIPNLKSEIETNRRLSLVNGCCLQNKNLFVIDHILVNTIREIMKN